MTATETKVKRERTFHSAREKAEAVLAFWTERRRPSQICRELKITPNQLAQWQDRAMEGILAALAPRTGKAEDPNPALPARLERLLVRKTTLDGPSRLSKRLKALDQAKEPEKPPTGSANRP
jgi:transposase-like protein